MPCNKESTEESMVIVCADSEGNGDIIKELAHRICLKFLSFSYGIRILYLINREVGNTNKGSSRWVKKIITTTPAEYKAGILQLLEIRKPHERIYASVEPRDFKKAIRIFKHKMLDNDYQDDENKFNFYRNIYNNWISALSSPESRADKRFLLDCDIKSNLDIVLEILKDCGANVIFIYETSKGSHIITMPFSIPREVITSLSKLNVEVKKNALLLLYWDGCEL